MLPFTPDIWVCARELLGGPRCRPWDWRSLRYPYWRVYWNKQPGAWIEHAGRTYPADPESVLVVAPNALTDLHQETHPVDHVYIHATLGHPHDSVSPSVWSLPATQVRMDLLAAVLPQHAAHHVASLTPRQTFAAHAALAGVLAALPEDLWPPLAGSRVLDSLLRRIAAEPERLWRVPETARMCGMSEATLLRRFRAETSMSPARYVTECRIQKACLLLHHTEHSIEQIATSCGYRDRYTFSKAFSRSRGKGPSAFRAESNFVFRRLSAR